MRTAQDMEREDGPVVYPDSDGQPMADNTLQFSWIQRLQSNLDHALVDFVAGDLLWYPVQGDPKTRVAPDVLVALGRPKGHRGSYRTWEEDGIAPAVVVEVLSPSNSMPEMMRKMQFYLMHGVQEFWVVDPAAPSAFAFIRGDGGSMDLHGTEDGFQSPLLGIRFHREDGELSVYYADGTPFWSPTEAYERIAAEQERADSERERADSERERADSEKERADSEKERADSEKERAEALVAQLRALGIDPEA